jgi:phosphoglycerate dehydrogenase-like enzyme
MSFFHTSQAQSSIFAIMGPGMIKLMLHPAQEEVSFLKDVLRLGIKVANTPGVGSNATADAGLFLLLGAIRNFNSGIVELRRG